MNEYYSLYLIYRLRQLLYLWSNVRRVHCNHTQRWVHSFFDILNMSSVKRIDSEPVSLEFDMKEKSPAIITPRMEDSTVEVESGSTTPTTPVTVKSTPTSLSMNEIVGICGMTEIQISLPSELFFGNPQLPPDPDNRFIPVSLHQPTTIFAYAMSTKKYLGECAAMRKLVLEGGTAGCCDNERFLLDRNDNEIKIVLDLEENGIPQKVVCLIFFATQVSIGNASHKLVCSDS